MVSGCGGDGGGTAKGVNLVAKDTLTVCTHLPYKPFEFTDKNGEVVGFDIDLTNLLAKRLGVKQKIVDVDWNQVTSGAAFKAKKCDIGGGAMTITPEREDAILISDPYFNAAEALLTKSDAGISDLADLNGKKVGVMADSTSEIVAKKFVKEYGFKIVTFDDYALEVNAVQSGTVAAVINDNSVLYHFAKSNPDTKVVPVKEFDTGLKCGFAALKNDANAKKLMDMMNDVLADADSDGTMDELRKKWFGDVPASMTS